MSFGGWLGAVRFELARRARERASRAALACLLLTIAACGWGLATGRLDAPGVRELVPVGYLLSLSFILRLGTAPDVELGFAEVLVPGLMSPAEWLAARLAVALLTIVATALVAGLGMTLAFAGDARLAAWQCGLCTLLALAALPWVVLLELGLRTRTPLLGVLVLGSLGLGAVAGTSAGPEILAGLGLVGITYPHAATLAPLALRVIGCVPLSLLLVYPLVRRELLGDGGYAPSASAARSILRTISSRVVRPRSRA